MLLALCLVTAQQGLADDAALAPPSRLRLGGFADVVLRSSPTNTARHLVELDMYSTLRISDAWSALAEGIAERTWRPPEAGEKPTIDLNLERLYVAYQTSDAFRLEFGETHTGIVRWNEREHRSRFLQTPIEVPAIARQPQDDGAWPTRFVGLWASGQTRGPMRFRWEGGAGAGPGSERDSIPIFSPDRSPAGFLSASVAPFGIEGWESGFAVYTQHIPSKPIALRERDFTLFSNYVNRGTEIRAEWARMEHQRTRMRQIFRNQGYYVLISKRLRGSAEHARPYVLVDHLNLDSADPYLREATNENAWAAGLRYDFKEWLSAKGEFRAQRALDGSRKSIIGLQIGVSF
jgi:hypothetical protein